MYWAESDDVPGNLPGHECTGAIRRMSSAVSRLERGGDNRGRERGEGEGNNGGGAHIGRGREGEGVRECS